MFVQSRRRRSNCRCVDENARPETPFPYRGGSSNRSSKAPGTVHSEDVRRVSRKIHDVSLRIEYNQVIQDRDPHWGGSNSESSRAPVTVHSEDVALKIRDV